MLFCSLHSVAVIDLHNAEKKCFWNEIIMTRNEIVQKSNQAQHRQLNNETYQINLISIFEEHFKGNDWWKAEEIGFIFFASNQYRNLNEINAFSTHIFQLQNNAFYLFFVWKMYVWWQEKRFNYSTMYI